MSCFCVSIVVRSVVGWGHNCGGDRTCMCVYGHWDWGWCVLVTTTVITCVSPVLGTRTVVGRRRDCGGSHVYVCTWGLRVEGWVSVVVVVVTFMYVPPLVELRSFKGWCRLFTRGMRRQRQRPYIPFRV